MPNCSDLNNIKVSDFDLREAKVLVGIATALITTVLVFAVQNIAWVDFQLFKWELTAPRSVLILLVLLAGFVLGWASRAICRTLNEASNAPER